MTMRHPSSSAARSRNPTGLRSVPPGYANIRDLLEASYSVGGFVSVIGLVKDRRLPIQTSGSDWKSTLTLYDKSIEDEPEMGLLFNIFRPQNEIPEPGASDVVVVISAKVQTYRGEISLLTNRTTAIHIYSADAIPKPPRSAKLALQAPLRPKDRLPKDPEHEYVSWLYHSIDKDSVPGVDVFKTQVDQSRNVKQKFQTLDGVQDSQFCDAIVNVIKDPFDQMGTTTLWVSDYTQNDAFYHFSWDPAENPKGRDGDPYGYTTTKIAAANTWPGPYGKRSIQVTCFGIHGEFIMKEVKAGDWVHLRNLNIKYGHNGNNLEGFMREDRQAYHSGLRVEILTIEDKDNIDDRLKEAIRRKRDYEKTKKQQQKSLATRQDGNRGEGKRKAGKQEGKPSARQRRAQERAQILEKVEAQEQESKAKLGLNELIRCENNDQPIFAISSIVEPVPWTTTVDGQEVTLTLPFTCAKYRANVRVVDFRPPNLADFTTWQKSNEYDMLSDHGGNSDSESDDDKGTLDRYTGEKSWEWRFALLLEEANPKNKGDCNRLWAVVDNTAAQLLLNLDALDLKANPDDLGQLQDQLVKLWGNLQECKQQELEHQVTNKQRVANHIPPPTSPPGSPSSHEAQTGSENQLTVSNKPFTCCIHQYGIKVPEEDPRKANAGEGKRWERVFGLFGTKISS
ncbi:hypothetical protein F4804DRAFT_282428 [Jackrogersella minutella]|nr:hypothetical protein F4804DRAFT_282428 [Jackrogersella minutella]